MENNNIQEYTGSREEYMKEKYTPDLEELEPERRAERQYEEKYKDKELRRCLGRCESMPEFWDKCGHLLKGNKDDAKEVWDLFWSKHKI